MITTHPAGPAIIRVPPAPAAQVRSAVEAAVSAAVNGGSGSFGE